MNEKQQQLYEMTLDELMRINREDAQSLAKIKDETIEHRNALKLLNRQRDHIIARRTDRDLNGAQMVSADLTKIVPSGTTKAERDADYKAKLIAQAKTILAGCGGLMSNRDLASMLGADLHGLTGYLADCPEIEKKQDGRERNEQTYWRLRGIAK